MVPHGLRLLILSLATGGMLACARTKVPHEVWLDQAPHLLEPGWRLPQPGERGVVATTARSVVEFFFPRSAPLRMRLHGWSTGPDPVTVHITLNGGCEVGSWSLGVHEGDGVLPVTAACVSPGINLLEMETRGPSPGGFALESLTLDPADAPGAADRAAEDAPLIEPVRVGLELRTAVISGARSFEVPLRLEGPSILETALALPGRGWTRSTVQVRVRLHVRPARGQTRLIAERVLGAGGEGAASWDPVRADLSELAGQAITLRIERETVPAEGGAGPSFPPFADPARLVVVEAPRVLPLRAEPGGAPPVVLVVFDTLRADHLPMYGYGRKTAPHLEALARDGVTFETCLSPSPWTLPSVASILTGLYPWQHQAGLRRHLKDQVSRDDLPMLAPFRTFRMVSRMTPRARTLAERMTEAGYLSAGFVENSYLSDRSGLANGFARYLWAHDLRQEVEDPAKRRRFFSSDLPVREWIEGHETSRLFLFRHYIAPHPPYLAIPGFEQFVRPQDAPELGHYFLDEYGLLRGKYGPAAKRRILDLYDETILLADQRFGDLIATLKRAAIYDRALVIVTSDHGEEFWDHGGYGHGHSLYQEVLKVPLIVKLPGGRLAGRRIAAPVRLVDLVPTILEHSKAHPGLAAAPAAGPAATPAAAPAAAVAPAAGTAAATAPGHHATVPLSGRPLPFDRADPSPFEAFAGAVLYGPPRRMAWRETLALIVSEPQGDILVFADRPSPPARPAELYDMTNDPAQKRDLSASRPDLVQRLKRVLESGWASPPLEAPPAGGLELSQEEIEQLESLGYAAGKPPR